jgi:hypothetical protein
MISFLQALAAGNAVSVILQPPQGARKWSVLRKPTNDIAGLSDPAATLVYTGADKYFVDTSGLINGLTYFYQPFYFDGIAWSAAATASVVPECSFEFIQTDVQTFLRDRIAAGLVAAVARQAIFPESGVIPVLTAAPVFEDVSFPVVTVHMQSDGSAERAVGEAVGVDTADECVGQFEGWLSRYQIAIAISSLSSDERITLRNLVKSIVQVNLQVFEAAGMELIDLQFSDQEDFTTYNVPMFQSLGSFSCVAPASVQATVPLIDQIDTNYEF